MTRSKHDRKADGLQWKLDDELKDKPPGEVTITPGPDDEIYSNSAAGRGGENPPLIENINKRGRPSLISSPPTPPSLLSPTRPKTCLYEDPATRETIRRNLKDLGVTNTNQLIRNYQAADLLEAIYDFRRAIDAGMRIQNPTGYFRSLLA